MNGIRTKKRWRDMTPGQKAGLVAVGTVQLALLVAALADIRRRPASAINGSKWLWTALSFINWVGPIA